MSGLNIKSKRWTSVQIMRGLAAVLVAAYHFEDQLMAVLGQATGSGPLSWFGFFGVDLFFITSGFVIWPMISKANLLINDRINFVVGRALRIYVPYLSVLFVVLYMQLGNGQADVAKSFILFPQKISAQILPVAWTLVYEVLFYILAFCLMFIPSPRHRYYAMAAIMAAFLLKAVFVILLSSATVYDYYAFLINVSYNKWVDGLLLGTLTSLWFLEFFTGVTISYALSKGYGEKLASHVKLGWVISFVLLTFAVFVSANVYGVSMNRGDMLIPRIALFGGAAALIFASALVSELSGMLTRIPKRLVDIMEWVGNGSYSIYLIHMVAFGAAYNIGFRDWCMNNGLLGVTCFIFFFLAVIMCSALIGNYVELPVHKKLTSIIRYKQMIRPSAL